MRDRADTSYKSGVRVLRLGPVNVRQPGGLRQALSVFDVSGLRLQPYWRFIQGVQTRPTLAPVLASHKATAVATRAPQPVLTAFDPSNTRATASFLLTFDHDY
jgi:hypothetical protein